MIRSLEVLGTLNRLDEERADELIEYALELFHKCHAEDPSAKGFGGGYMQEPQALTCYAVSMALMILGARFNKLPYIFQAVDRKALYNYYLSLKVTDPKDPHFGAFRATKPDGEIDNRTVYGVLASASLFGILDERLKDGTAEWVAKTQTYEGGFADVSGSEAHGGYAYCALASLIIMGRPELCDLEALLSWATKRQFAKEGGFSGRTNKLVDGCYSFWVGGLFPLIRYAKALIQAKQLHESKQDVKGLNEQQRFAEAVRKSKTIIPRDDGGWLFDTSALQQYLIMVSQTPFMRPGLRDKPSISADLYHTCYCLSGLAVAQHSFSSGSPRSSEDTDYEYDEFGEGSDEVIHLDMDSLTAPEPNPNIFGAESNEVVRSNPIYNVSEDTIAAVSAYLETLEKQE